MTSKRLKKCLSYVLFCLYLYWIFLSCWFAICRFSLINDFSYFCPDFFLVRHSYIFNKVIYSSFLILFCKNSFPFCFLPFIFVILLTCVYLESLCSEYWFVFSFCDFITYLSIEEHFPSRSLTNIHLYFHLVFLVNYLALYIYIWI